jgi:spermidine synthase
MTTPPGPPAVTAAPRSRRRELASCAGLALVAGGVLAAEIAWTRYFSFRLWYHYAFMIIGVAMLGLGSGGTAMALARERLAAIGDARVLSASALLFSLTLGASVALLARLDDLVAGRLESFGAVALAWIVLFVPFFFAGCAISWAIRSMATTVHRAYASDLLGAALGALAAALLLDRMWPERVLGLAALASIAAAGSFRLAEPTRSRRHLAATVLAAAATLPALLLDARSAAGITATKGLRDDLARGGRIVASYPGAHGRVDVVSDALGGFAWGLDPAFRTKVPPQLAVRIDGDALTAITRFDGDLRPWDFAARMPSDLPYAIASPREVLVIGPGGGMDVVNALRRGATRVTGVEVNRRVIEAVARDFAEFAGGIYSDPRVEIVHGDGRNFVERARVDYDLVQLTLVDTFAAISSGALALSEDFLYTREAFAAYLDALAPDGILALGRTVPEALPLTVLLERASRPLGVDVARHLFVAGNPERPHSLIALFKRSPLSPSEIDAAAAFAQAAGLRIVYAPGREGVSDRSILAFFGAGDRDAFVDGWPHDIAPESDDRPFYFRSSKWSQLLGTHVGGEGNLWAMLGVSVLFAGVGIVAPLVVGARSPLEGHGELLGYFAAIGLAFIFVELALITKLIVFLGHPARSLTVTLFSLLLFSGLGSAASRRAAAGGSRSRGAAGPGLALGAIAALTLAYALGLSRLLALGMGLPLPARIAIAVAAIAPLGLLMGMPLPVVLARLEGSAPRLVLWAWGLNAVATVVGAVAAALLARRIGFSGLLALGAALYLVAGGLARSRPKPARGVATA